ncbi:MAG: hypothetical protein OXI96_03890, partial [Acidimicrobiaceae bacterium]|nr:hypothetical protein [Acidimicrobiaceae bacterium]
SHFTPPPAPPLHPRSRRAAMLGNIHTNHARSNNHADTVIPYFETVLIAIEINVDVLNVGVSSGRPFTAHWCRLRVNRPRFFGLGF